MKYQFVASTLALAVSGFAGSAAVAEDISVPDGGFVVINASDPAAGGRLTAGPPEPLQVVVTLPNGTIITAEKCTFKKDGTMVCV